MHRAFVVFGVVALAGCPNKNSPERRARVALAEFTAFRDKMCMCKDKACADKVQEELTKWATDMAKDAPRDEKPDEEMIKKMTDVGQTYGECMTKAMGYEPPLPPRDDVPPASDSHAADSLLRDARVWARAKQPEHLVAGVRVAYVDANGELDPEHGALDIVFGRTSLRVDDPKRKIGAPVVARQDANDCFELTWNKAGWSRITYGCTETYDVAARCTVTEIWKRAIARKAPAEALASLTLTTKPDGGSWELRIQDEPREINIVESFADDCPLAVEK